MASQESVMLRLLLKQFSANQTTGEFNLQAARQALEMLSGQFPLAPDTTVEETTVQGIPAEWVYAPSAASDCVFLYLHGGAYIMGSLNTHRDLASKLSRATGARALVIDYRLAPEHPYPAALEDALTAYRWLISSGYAPENIIIGGDSAGGGLTLSTLLTLRADGDALPAAAVLLSPWTDLSGTGESMESRKEFDPWLSPESTRMVPVLYIHDLDPRDPLVSPVFADLAGLPPMLVHVGHDEILLDDSVRLVEQARAAGIDVTFKIWEEMWHVFQTFPIPEAAQSIEEIGAFVVKQLGKVKS
jgi:monoterpene epsilon-lactone hydrolase